jgi:murein DD-endopeptidase MepM/ murein hydrolase activator NlpD
MSSIPPGIDLVKSIDLRPGADPVRERAQVAKLAQEFEAMLMLQMIRGMRQSMLEDDGESEGLGGETMKDTFDVELTRSLAQAGGLGLGSWLSQQLAAKAANAEATPAVGDATLLRRAEAAGLPLREVTKALSLVEDHAISLPGRRNPVAPSENRQSQPDESRKPDTPSDEIRLLMPLESVTTSAYGWRSDPLNGRSTFHKGVDLRGAYGTEVPAAAAGTVVFAGERGGYGNMVVVRHADGVETRYAHLSSIEVAQGAPVAAGAVVGRVGSTGRSTAPHLHFEVLVNGERVDPERAAARVGTGPLKFGSQADD